MDKTPMPTWSHRVIKSVNEFGELHYQIHEVYYNKAGELTMYTERAIPARGETFEELREDLELMLQCLEKPVLEADKIVFAKPDWGEINADSATLEELEARLDFESLDTEKP